MPNAKYDDFRVSGYISLWLGNFTSEIELDDYLSGEFETDFGFEIYPPSGPEADVSVDRSKPVGQLLEGFSRRNLFIDAAVVAAAVNGWKTATTAVVFYGFKYDPKFINPNGSGRLRFIEGIPLKRAFT